MNKLRSLLFWTHLVLGVAAGGVILITVVTGSLMAFQKQVVAWAERPEASGPPASGVARLPLAEILERASEGQGDGVRPFAVTVSSDPRIPVRVEFDGGRRVAVEAYTGVTTPLEPGRARAAFRWIENCHRRLGSGETGARIVGVSTVAFLSLCVSGLVLWFPRRFTAKAFLVVMRPRLGLPARARDWNWHNAVGFWCSLPLSVMAFTGLVMAFHGFGDWIYGPRPERGGGPPSAATVPTARPLPLAELVSRVLTTTEGWTEISVRTDEGRGGGRGGARDEGRGNREGGEPRRGREGGDSRGEGPSGPEARREGGSGWGGRMIQASVQKAAWRLPETFGIDPSTGERVPGLGAGAGNKSGFRSRLRELNRPIHTGEVGGVAGQAVTFLAACGGMLLVYTGFSLALRRVFARASRTTVPEGAPPA